MNPRSAALAAVLMLAPAFALAQDVCGPNKTTDLAIDTGKTTAVAQCTQPTDDCGTGTASSVVIRRYTSPITEANWHQATTVYSGSWADCMELDDAGAHTCNTTYYWAMKSIDDAGNHSPLSNVVQEATGTCSPPSPEIHCGTLLLRGIDGSLAPPPVQAGGVSLTANIG